MKTRLNNRGIAMVMVIAIVALLLSITGAALLLGGLSLKTSSNLKTGGGAIHVADAGIQHGLALIPVGSEFDSLLTGSVTGFTCGSPCNGTGNKPTLTGSLSDYTYSVVAENDPSESTSPTNDGNRIVTLTSTATGPNGAKRKIKAYIGRSGNSYVPPGAVYIPSTSASQDWDLTGSFLVDGKDTNYSPFGSGPNTAIIGIAPTSDAIRTAIVNTLTDKGKLANVQGLGYVPSPTAPSVTTTTTQIDVSQVAQAFINSADATYSTGLTKDSNSCPNAPTPQPISCQLGTDLLPKITYINNGASLYGTVTGSGVLIIKGRARLGENFEFHGLLIHLLPDTEQADAELEFRMENNAKIYGSMMLGPQGGQELEFEMKNSSKLYYSSQAMNMVGDRWPTLMPKAAKLIGWHEVMQ